MKKKNQAKIHKISNILQKLLMALFKDFCKKKKLV